MGPQPAEDVRVGEGGDKPEPALARHAGWQWDELGQALVAIAVVAAVSMTLCFGARDRLEQA